MGLVNASYQEIIQIGYDRGTQFVPIAKQDLPVIGIDVGDRDEWQEKVLDKLIIAEESTRQFSTFKFIVCELNEREDCEFAWDTFEEGIHDAFNEFLRDQRPLIKEDVAEKHVIELLNNVYDTVNVCGYGPFEPGPFLYQIDYVAFRQEMLNWLDSEKLDLA